MKLATITAFSLGMAVTNAGPIYTLADLGTLGGSSTMAAGINDQGQAVGSATTMVGYMHAFSSFGSGLTDLTANPSAQGQASGINNAGQIAGTQYLGGQAYATVWSDGAANIIGSAGSYAVAINSAGEVAGMLVNNGQGTAFVAQNGTVIDLGTFAGGSWSAAYGLNDAGQAAGYGMTANGSFRAFIWTPGQGYTALGTFGGASSYAMAINNSGAATGNAQTSSGFSHAFLSNGATMQDLGTLGGIASYGYGINDAGNVVGYSWTTGNNSLHGFLEEGGVMWDINSLLIEAPGWVVTQLYGINGSNQVVGVGIFDGVEHAVLLTDPPASTQSESAVPEPATWMTSAALLAFFLSFRRASRPSR
jgi:probable HAF family extracellular repeat protein